ncbi:Transcriptional regulatory protein ZraR [Sporotomaculum syntrophicum]|uniref:Transcriptional regulatory protein ZraR n=1 Tax=Sporotomaculum syntrophicum TaxID=182264 RepID=A0A9D2WQV5_9FIRM|nr:sigma-54-dependent Fis family transcriptional regulator [Sporotomaculum syntrophicum]KAF1085699.1 Transcriptional regulatory protein ZraR [Sporotomaculum syntrophicum]
MKAKEIMVPINVSLKPDSTMKDALLVFRSTRLTGVSVHNQDGRLIGMFTRDILDDCLLKGTSLETCIQKYYLRDIMCIREDLTINNLADIISWLRSSRIEQTPVIDINGRPVGIINHTDAINQLLDHIRFTYKEIADIFQKTPCGLVATDVQGKITLVSVYLKQTFPDIRVGQQIKELLAGLSFDKIINGVSCEPQKVKLFSTNVIVNGLPMLQGGRINGAILLLQETAAISASIHSKKEDNRQELSLVNKITDNNQLFKQNGTKYTIDCFISQSPCMVKIKSQALQAAKSSSTVLICGESGVGKELLAQSIHNASNRYKRPFIKVDCTAISAGIAEIELFGYEGGAFTGALKHGKPGQFELADGGTIFFDEIGSMPWSLQGRLLRVLQEKEIERVGGITTKKIDVRIIAATNQDLYKLTLEGRFRKELYYRLNVLDITIPPLRKHIKDIPLLVNHLVDKYNKKYGKQIKGVSDDTMVFFKTYQWPGNIGELENVIERAIAGCHLDLIQIDLLGTTAWEQNKRLEHIILAESTKEMAREAQKKAIANALKITKGNKSRAAKLLGISRTTLYDKLKTQITM